MTNLFIDRRHRTRHYRWCRMKPAFRLLGLMLLLGSTVGCMHFRPPPIPPDEAAEQMIAAFQRINSGLDRFKCIANLTIVESDRQMQTLRIAVAGQSPNYLRIDVLAPFGGTAASFSSNGRHLYLVRHATRDFFKTRLGSGSLKRLVKVDIAVEELLTLLMGRIPIGPNRVGRLVADEGALQRLVLFDQRGRQRQQITVDADQQPVEVVWLDKHQDTMQRLTLSGHLAIDGFILPKRIELVAASGARVSVRIDRYESNVALNQTMFTLEPLSS